MQVLWDLRKTFRCAVLTDSTSDITNVAEQVVRLFTAGSRDNQNTVLLLLNEEQILESLQEIIMMKLAEQKINTRMPVVTLLSCVRKDVVLQNDQVILREELSHTEQQRFNEKAEELRGRYGDKYEQFHAFRIMQTNFSRELIKQACTVFRTVKRANRPRRTQLAAFLSLLNAYVPGSYLLESQCLAFLKHEDRSLEDQMEPFSDLIITFQEDKRSDKKVCMVHPVLAQQCTELMAEAGVTRSDTARNFLNYFCRNEVPSFLLAFIKDMLTKREVTNEEREDKFSRLILDIQNTEHKVQSASVLKVASKKFDQNPFFPQALARFCYIELKDYNQAEMWAKRAKERCPQNSFVADTLGQVHKNQLKNQMSTATAREILQLAKKAIDAFKHEEQLAEEEIEENVKKTGRAKSLPVSNTRGQFGYLQVCNILYDLLVGQNEAWKGVLTKNQPMHSVLNSLGDNKLYRFNHLINSLRDEVERKCDFFDQYLVYSKLNVERDDPDYISKDTTDCYMKYVAHSTPSHIESSCAQLIQKLEQSLTDKGHVEVLSHLVREYTESELQDVTTRWGENSSSTDSGTAAVDFMLAGFRQKMPLSKKDAPELYMVALLLYWPDSEDSCLFDLSQMIRQMRSSYEHVYKKYLGSRYLHPLFFIGKGQGLNRIVQREVLEELFLDQSEETSNWSDNWRKENLFKNASVQAHLLRVKGVVRNYRVHALVGGKEIEVDANVRNSLWRPRPVFFYLGFTIRGPVAFGIQSTTGKIVKVKNN
uniref:Uncharacterized protein n=1 Tax=Stegastes partitus TaxID=144197 RepID=A0A3B5AGE6_9TELE